MANRAYLFNALATGTECTFWSVWYCRHGGNLGGVCVSLTGTAAQVLLAISEARFQSHEVIRRRRSSQEPVMPMWWPRPLAWQTYEMLSYAIPVLTQSSHVYCSIILSAKTFGWRGAPWSDHGLGRGEVVALGYILLRLEVGTVGTRKELTWSACFQYSL